jgi:hypothetical protein
MPPGGVHPIAYELSTHRGELHIGVKIARRNTHRPPQEVDEAFYAQINNLEKAA